jgi:hypothetical protein
MKLSELQNTIKETIEKYGDMDVIRIRSLDIDGMIQNEFDKNVIRYSSDDFWSSNFCTVNGPNRYFVIGTPLYDKD